MKPSHVGFFVSLVVGLLLLISTTLSFWGEAKKEPLKEPPALVEVDVLKMKLARAELNALQERIGRLLAEAGLTQAVKEKETALNKIVEDAAKAQGVDLKLYLPDPDKKAWVKR